jgi:oligopeptide/dipeptide ABC transporter ATP-binding protein
VSSATVTAPPRTILDVRDLAVEVHGHDPPLRPVRSVSFSLGAGERLGLVGESGSGKSLTALSLMRLLPRGAGIAAGSVQLLGRELTTLSEREMAGLRGGRIAMVYQDPMSSLNPMRTIGDQVVEAIRVHERVGRGTAKRRAIDLLGHVGLPQPARRFGGYPHQFSGGMRQRVMIAMAIAAGPQVLIADEPTTALDVTTQARIMDLLDELVAEREMAVLLITHDLALAGSFCDTVQVMYAGRIVERGQADAVLESPVHPYTEALVGSICRIDADLETAIEAIPGQPPLPDRLPSGCPFHPRCAYAAAVCAEREPELETLVEGRAAACHFAAERAGVAP